MTDELKARLRAIKHVALDMDGTIYLGSTLFPYTIPFLEKLDRLGIGYSFLTNNPTKSIDAYLENLRKRGVPCRPDQMYSSAVATVDYIRTHFPEARSLFLLRKRLRQSFNRGFISFNSLSVAVYCRDSGIRKRSQLFHCL